jgi:T-complex protein 1 subunit theta
MEEAIRGISDSGAKVIVAGGSISEIAMHFIEKYGMMAVKVISKFEMRRLCKAVGATALVRVGPPMPDELGFASTVSVQELSSRLVTVFRQDGEDSSIATIVLRGSTTNLLDDMERAVDDAVNVARNLCKDGRMVPGAGAAEMELATRMGRAASEAKGLETYAIGKFGEALEIVARTLAENSGQNATELITALYLAHQAGGASVGVDVEGAGNGTFDAAAVGVLDSLVVKLSALRMASETALTILKVDQIIMSKQGEERQAHAPLLPLNSRPPLPSRSRRPQAPRTGRSGLAGRLIARTCTHSSFTTTLRGGGLRSPTPLASRRTAPVAHRLLQSPRPLPRRSSREARCSSR